MAESKLSQSEPEQDLEIVRPDFSSFSMNPVSWNITWGDNFSRDSHMMLLFTSSPSYNNQPINRRDPIEIKLGNKTIKMIVREIQYMLSAGKVTTRIILASKAILLDTFIPKGYVFGTASPGVDSVLREILSVLNIRLDIDVDNINWTIEDNSVDPGTSKLVISGRKKVLDFILDATKVGEQNVYSFWIDPFGVINFKNRGETKNNVSIEYENVLDRIMSFNLSLFDDYKEVESVYVDSVTTNIKTKIEEQVEFKMKVGNPVTHKISKPRISKTSGVSSTVFKGLESVPSYTQSLSFSFGGIDLTPPHSSIKLSGFPAGNGEYMLKSTAISDSTDAVPVTTWELASAEDIDHTPAFAGVNDKESHISNERIYDIKTEK